MPITGLIPFLVVLVVAVTVYAMNRPSRNFKPAYNALIFIVLAFIFKGAHEGLVSGAFILAAVASFLRLPIGKDKEQMEMK